MDSVVVYTNIEDAKGAKYNDYYAAGASAPTGAAPSGWSYEAWAGVASVAAQQTDGASDPTKSNVITLMRTVGAAHSLFDAAMLPTGGGITKTYPDGDDDTANIIEVEFAGSFNDVKGMFKCEDSTACTAKTNEKGDLSELSGTWTFTADSKDATVAGALVDADYLDFGYWVQTDDSGDTVEYMVNTFSRGAAPSSSVKSLEGSATYEGGAAGLYSKRELTSTGDGEVVAAGRFTADAELTAYFVGDDVARSKQDSISGTIKNFMDGETVIDDAWMVELDKIQGTKDTTFNPDAGTFSGGTTTGGGTWNGKFYGPVAVDADTDTDGNQSTLPSGVAGEFTAGFNNGSLIGSFGATKTTE